MAKEKGISIEPQKHADGRFMYTNEQLWEILKRFPAEKKVALLEKVIDTMENDNRPKSWAVADVLDCIYDDAGFWGRKTKIKIPRK